jgi:hypothetical protein
LVAQARKPGEIVFQLVSFMLMILSLGYRAESTIGSVRVWLPVIVSDSHGGETLSCIFQSPEQAFQSAEKYEDRSDSDFLHEIALHSLRKRCKKPRALTFEIFIGMKTAPIDVICLDLISHG